MRESDKQNGSKIIFRLVAIAIIFIGCVSVIASCVTVKTNTPALPEFTSKPVDIINTNTPRILLPTSTLYVSPTVAETPAQLYSATENNDYLVYRPALQIGKPQLALYDLKNNKYIYTEVSPTNNDWYVNSFSLSKDNRLAYEKDDNIYIWDYPFVENAQTEIIFDKPSTTEKGILSWSLDGHYLLLTGVQAGIKKLFLWDGKNFLEMYNHQREVYSYYATWGNDGKLAFTEYFTPNGNASEVFVWDGKDVFSLSQNPSKSPAWSKDGKLAFLSNQNGEYNIFVWDGVSKTNDMPDIETFSRPDSTISPFPHLTWTNSGSIVFRGRGKTDLHTQIYEWDGETTRNISQTPSIDNYGLAWGNDRYWSADGYYTVYVHDNTNRIIFETKGTASRWTQGGLLIFCRHVGNVRNDWTLSVWDGKNIVDVTHGIDIEAKWTNSNGQSITCTYG
ncbi:MAG: PD40 domain-containing protein [Chloroflexi bacterium]|nr:PD40 domain-containing protein [Chloroflexota bacterium]